MLYYFNKSKIAIISKKLICETYEKNIGSVVVCKK